MSAETTDQSKQEPPSIEAQKLFHLIKTNDIDSISQLTIDLEDLDATDADGKMILNYAREADNQALFNSLFSAIKKQHYSNNNKLDIDTIDYKGRSIAHWAAKCCQDFDTINQLINEGANVNDARNPFAATPLYLAAWEGYTHTAQALLKAGANVDFLASNGATPSHAAAENGHFEMIELLKSSGANFNLACHLGGTPLFVAAQNGHIPVVKTLIKAECNVDSKCHDGATPLFVASQNGNADIVKSLIQAQADVNATLHDGKTPLYAALKNKHEKIAEILKNAGAHQGYVI